MPAASRKPARRGAAPEAGPGSGSNSGPGLRRRPRAQHGDRAVALRAGLDARPQVGRGIHRRRQRRQRQQPPLPVGDGPGEQRVVRGLQRHAGRPRRAAACPARTRRRTSTISSSRSGPMPLMPRGTGAGRAGRGGPRTSPCRAGACRRVASSLCDSPSHEGEQHDPGRWPSSSAPQAAGAAPRPRRARRAACTMSGRGIRLVPRARGRTARAPVGAGMSIAR